MEESDTHTCRKHQERETDQLRRKRKQIEKQEQELARCNDPSRYYKRQRDTSNINVMLLWIRSNEQVVQNKYSF